MARIRSLHPTQCTDEDFVSLSPWARLLALHIRCEADDNGIFEWKPVALKMRIFPADSLDIEPLLEEMIAHKQVRRFEHDGRYYGAIRNFRKYQRPKKPNTTHPCPPEIATYVSSSHTSSEPVPHQLPTGTEKPPQMEEEEGGVEVEEDSPEGESNKLLFDEFWQGYPHPPNRGSKQRAASLFGRLPKRDQSAVVASIETLKNYCKAVTWYTPKMATTYLNHRDRHWENLPDVEAQKARNAQPEIDWQLRPAVDDKWLY